ncbi:hypothetical protein [Inquilinus limosus]|uniref:Uncharacterized protein n=1 Tax=Inquilinus limosus MP06 TaxID=1398085 RepID=A0A0A0DDM4_9PROT|nr:hypothetical protein [Inquilinus limosus]KGM36145.1 hypothetical protein P409_00420 [Inquilinus limosus MP06]
MAQTIAERAAKAKEAADKAKAKADALDRQAAEAAADKRIDTFAAVMDVATASFTGSRRSQVLACTAIGFAIVATAAGWVDGKSVGLVEAVERARAYITGQDKAEMSGTDKATFKRAKAVASRVVKADATFRATLAQSASVQDGMALLMTSLDAEHPARHIATVADLDGVLFPAKAAKAPESPWVRLAKAMVTRVEKLAEDGGPSGEELADLETALSTLIDNVDPGIIDRIVARRAATVAQGDAERLAAELDAEDEEQRQAA